MPRDSRIVSPAPTVAAARARLGWGPCTDGCDALRLAPSIGDVAMCACGQWWCHFTDGIVAPVSPQEAAELAREPMDNDEMLAAFDRAEAALAPI